jgi:hypothetical protein
MFLAGLGRAAVRSLLLSMCAWLACRTAPPPAPPVEPHPPAIPRTPCYLVALAYGSVQTGEAGTVLGGEIRLAVLEIDLETGALRTRAEMPVGDREVMVWGAAIRGDEVALLVHDGDGLASARVDLAAGRLEVSAPMPIEEMLAGRALASDGDAYYRYCRHGELCRGKDWELRGNPIELPSDVRFDEIAVAGGELYGIEDATVHVVDLASNRETRRFSIPRESRESGVGISGDELVTAGRQTLTRYDRATGEKRRSVRLALPPTVPDVRLTCGR